MDEEADPVDESASSARKSVLTRIESGLVVGKAPAVRKRLVRRFTDVNAFPMSSLKNSVFACWALGQRREVLPVLDYKSSTP